MELLVFYFNYYKRNKVFQVKNANLNSLLMNIKTVLVNFRKF